MLPTLTGARVRLRMLAEADLPRLLEIFGDPAVARFVGIPRLRDEHDARMLLADIVAHAESRTLLQWGLEELETGVVVGTCSLAALAWPHQRAEIGFALTPSRQGRGLMSEALRLLLSHAFEDLRLHRLEADVDPRNGRSLQLLEALGFEREGYARQRHVVDGERQDAVLLGLLAPAWLPASRASGRRSGAAAATSSAAGRPDAPRSDRRDGRWPRPRRSSAPAGGRRWPRSRA